MELIWSTRWSSWLDHLLARSPVDLGNRRSKLVPASRQRHLYAPAEGYSRLVVGWSAQKHRQPSSTTSRTASTFAFVGVRTLFFLSISSTRRKVFRLCGSTFASVEPIPGSLFGFGTEATMLDRSWTWDSGYIVTSYCLREQHTSLCLMIVVKQTWASSQGGL
jgi:hypothetical protein